MDHVRAWLVAFVLTVALESPIVVLFYRDLEPRRARLFALIFFANLATHPAVWFVFPRLPLAYAQYTTLAEVWAFGLEIIFYALVFSGSWRRAVAASVCANATSMLFGFAWQHFVGRF